MSEQGEQPANPKVGHRLKADVIAPPDFDAQDAAAIQALASGTADSGQQRRALDWIINFAAITYDMSYRPDNLGGDRASCFAEGRRYVGNSIILLTKVRTSKLQQE